MPALESLLRPIAGDTPGGQNLRYAPVSDLLREARRAEEEIEQGVWKREVKRADYPLVIGTASEALASQGKDLQVAAWLTEAWTATLGLPGLADGLQLLTRLLSDYWDSVHPLMDEDGDLELRATPLLWVSSQLDRVVRLAPATAGGYSLHDYRSSKAVPAEADANRDDGKRLLRKDAIERGAITPEDFDASIQGTPAEFYEERSAECQRALDAAGELAALCDEKFGDVSPNFSPLRDLLEEIKQTYRVLLVRKRDAQPQQVSERRAAPSPAPVSAFFDDDPFADDDGGGGEETGPVEKASLPEAQPAAAPRYQFESANDDPLTAVLNAADALRNENRTSPVPYLLSRAMRLGELLAAGRPADQTLLDAPPTHVRIALRTAALNSEWEDVLRLAEDAMATSCGRGWLDAQRYAITACEKLELPDLARGLRATLDATLRLYPELASAILTDDTPAANAETVEWLNPLSAAGQATTYEAASRMAKSGRLLDALALLSTELSRERSGRGRFLKKAELAQLCMETGNYQVALPILNDLLQEIERRSLEEWESFETLSHTVAMLYRCLDLTGDENGDKERVYAQLCRLDPARAVGVER